MSPSVGKSFLTVNQIHAARHNRNNRRQILSETDFRVDKQLLAGMELEVWNCSANADGPVDLMMACAEMAKNFTDSTSAGRLPLPRHTPTCRVYDFVVETILMGSLCLFGFAGNTLSMVCLWCDKSRSATPLLLISLEISDTLFLSAVLVVRVISSFQVRYTVLPYYQSYHRGLHCRCMPTSHLRLTGFLDTLCTIS